MLDPVSPRHRRGDHSELLTGAPIARAPVLQSPARHGRAHTRQIDHGRRKLHPVSACSSRPRSSSSRRCCSSSAGGRCSRRRSSRDFDQSRRRARISAPVRIHGVPLGQVSGFSRPRRSADRRAARPAPGLHRGPGSGSRDPGGRAQWRTGLLVLLQAARADPQLAGITGQQYLAIDRFDPKEKSPLPFDWAPEYPTCRRRREPVRRDHRQRPALPRQPPAGWYQNLGQNLNKLVVTLNRKVDELPSANSRRRPRRRSRALAPPSRG